MGRGSGTMVDAYLERRGDEVVLKPHKAPPDIGSEAHRSRLQSYARARAGRPDINLTLSKFCARCRHDYDKHAGGYGCNECNCSEYLPGGGSYTDMRGNITIQVDVPPQGPPEDRELCIAGLLRHELCHEMRTDQAAYFKFTEELERLRREGKEITAAQLQKLHNILEDGMIEERERQENPESYSFISALNRIHPRVGAIQPAPEDLRFPAPEGYVPVDADGNELPIVTRPDGSKWVEVKKGTPLNPWGKRPLHPERQIESALLAAAVPEFEPGELHPDVQKALDECMPHIDAAVRGNTSDCILRAEAILKILRRHGLLREDLTDEERQALEDLAGKMGEMMSNAPDSPSDKALEQPSSAMNGIPMPAPGEDGNSSIFQPDFKEKLGSPQGDGQNEGESGQQNQDGSSGGSSQGSGQQGQQGQDSGGGDDGSKEEEDQQDGAQGSGQQKGGEGTDGKDGKGDGAQGGEQDSEGKGDDKDGSGSGKNGGEDSADQKGQGERSKGQQQGSQGGGSQSAGQRQSGSEGSGQQQGGDPNSPGGSGAAGGYDPNRPLPKELRDRNEKEGRGRVDGKDLEERRAEARQRINEDKARQTAQERRNIRQGKLEGDDWQMPNGEKVLSQNQLKERYGSPGGSGRATGYDDDILTDENNRLHLLGRQLGARIKRLKTEAIAPQRYKRRGKLDRRRYAQAMAGNPNVFYRPGVNLDLDLEIDVTIDRSSSVTPPLTAQQYRMAHMLAVAARETKVPMTIYGWAGGFGDNCQHYAYKERHSNDMSSLPAIFRTGGGGTPTAEGVRFARARLRHSKAKQKVMVVITDGAANDIQAAAEQVQRAKQQGIEVIGLAFYDDGRGPDPHHMDAQFGAGNWQAIDDYLQAPKIVGKLIEDVAKKKMRRG